MIVCYVVAFLACVIGKICGMGGGVIIKPVLDAAGTMSVASVNFLSGCTVLGMSCWSGGKAVIRHDTALDFHVSTPLALGASLGGVLGKYLYAQVSACFENPDLAGGVQAVLLFAATFATLVYTLRKDLLPQRRVRSLAACMAIGACLGAMGAFLGIGGGPFNMAVLFYFFSMSAKTAAQNSLFMILVSQLTGLLQTVVSASVPETEISALLGMVGCGILGSELGGHINKRLREQSVTRLLVAAMVLVMAISVYNMALKF